MPIKMKSLLQLEEIAQFILSILLFTTLDYNWWVYPTLFFLPDISIVGYLANNRFGAGIYNFFHHKLLAILLFIIGFFFHYPLCALIGIILLGHSSFDRILGYGLKYNDHFKNTHLGWIGKKS